MRKNEALGERDHQCDRVCLVRWYYMSDRDRFHVYVRADITPEKMPRKAPKNYKTKPHRQRRIDWQKTSTPSGDVSTLEFHNYTPKRGETSILLGETNTYCMRCIQKKIRGYLREYHLFDFNCRTVSYLILVEVLGFDANWVYEQFQKNSTLCGLGDRTACMSIDEIYHYIAWRRTRGESIFTLQ